MEILIADDHAVVRRGLKDILAEEFPEAQFAESATADEVMAQLAKAAFSVLMLDLSMPGSNGLGLLHAVREGYPRLPIIVLTMHPEDEYAVRCLRAGASAFINKESIPEELAQATRKVVGGGRYVSAHLAEKLVAQFNAPDGKPVHEQLSDREHEVLKMLASGTALIDIAERLQISSKTVSTYRTRILEKMQMKSNAELTRYALQHKLIE